MNSVNLIGRLTRDPESVGQTNNNSPIVKFNLAIDRPTSSNGEKQTDFPRITVFGRQAENCLKYLAKGRKVAVEGRIQTGSYQKDTGDTVYTTDVIANRVEFLEWGDTSQQQSGYAGRPHPTMGHGQTPMDLPPEFESVQEEVPF